MQLDLCILPKLATIMSAQQNKIKAVFFDFMGTCLDWHISVVTSLSKDQASKLALEWRRQYFLANNERFLQNLEPEDIDVTLARVLKLVLHQNPEQSPHFSPASQKQLIEAWHSQPAWPEVRQAIQSIRQDLGLEVFVHANGTTRLQLDLTRSSGLSFRVRLRACCRSRVPSP